jgi:hypothetical protein
LDPAISEQVVVSIAVNRGTRGSQSKPLTGMKNRVDIMRYAVLQGWLQQT